MSRLLQFISSILLSLLLSNKTYGISFNTNGCGTSKGCFRSPETCTTSENCDFLITYAATNSGTVEFELSGNENWIAVGFSDNQEMAETDILMCVSDESEKQDGHYYANSQQTPEQTVPTPSSAVNISAREFVDNRMKCRVSRVINPGLTNFKDLNSSLFLLAAYGPLGADGGISQHNLRRSSSERVRVLETRQVNNDRPIDAKVLAHGILMTLAWTLFAFVGLFTARYMRQVWQPTKIWGKDAWFTVHRVLMTTTVLLTVTGTILIFVEVKGWSSGAGAHPICGMIAIILAVIQPIMAALRPSPNAPKREIFNWSHRIVGTVALVMAVVSIYLGLDQNQVGLGKQGLYAVIAFYIGEFLVFVFEFYLILSKRNKEKRTMTGDIPMQSSGVETQQQQQPDMSPQEAMIRTMMFVFVILVGFSVSLTIIILLVSKE
ncbi:ferric-chelate reductase 1-like isoform X1 [Acropora millepora]|uniref:ferric-chelate reductase 1-like isoform X1 n=1 Tax=Acropora millepora TaxID=45264 RepID=UPI001CF5BDE9|nr:ferric-chelate reductase 1-like isoform X1 [Acropora millepora]XP_029198571.2 ferric-chelate reductase 1-like isoform X1 [Acropora millepora]